MSINHDRSEIDPVQQPDEAWLNLAQKRDLQEEDYKTLLAQLPKDEASRNIWLEHLRLHTALGAMSSAQGEPSSRNVAEDPKRAPSRFKVVQTWLGRAVAASLMGGVFLSIWQPSFHRAQHVDSPESHAEVLRSEGGMAVHMEEKELVLESEDSFSEDLLVESTRVEAQALGSTQMAPPSPSSIAMGSTPMLMDESASVVSKQRRSELRVKKSRAAAPMATPALASLSKAELRSAEPSHAQVLPHAPHLPPAPHVPQGFVFTKDDPLSTFSIDVDTASYVNVRRHLREGRLPPKESVRIEEMINYFSYAYALPDEGRPFSMALEMGDCPWEQKHRLLKVAIKGQVDLERPALNLVFLLDVSGSMNAPQKLPLLKRSMNMLLKGLNENDRVAVVAYAGHTGVVLESTPASDHVKIMSALNRLVAQGGTHGEGGIQLAYRLAQQNFAQGAVNRVVLATDGDFNVGLSSPQALKGFIEQKRETGIELSVLGFGRGGVNDKTMETLAQYGNGQYHFIDDLQSARKALVSELDSNLVTIAKDVKLQLAFNPEKVLSFRRIGYDNRQLAHRDFEDDRIDAGELGMGHSVTALYEIELHDDVKSDDLLVECRLRYKEPRGDQSQLLKTPLLFNPAHRVGIDFEWAAATAAWGQLLRGEAPVRSYSLDQAIELAKRSRGADEHGYRADMIQWMETHRSLLETGSKTRDDAPEALPEWQFRK